MSRSRFLGGLIVTLYLFIMILLFVDGYKAYFKNSEQELPNKVTITFRHFWVQDYNLPVQNIVSDVIEQFEQKYPMYKIQFEEMDQTIHREQKLKSEMVTGTQPDIIALFGGAEIQPYIRANRLMDLSEWIDEKNLKVKFKDIHLWTFDDKIYGLPFEGNAEPLFYNKQIFESLSLKPPTTVEELFEVVTVLKENGYIPFALGNADLWQGAIFAHYFMDIYAGNEQLTRILNGRGSFSSEAYKQAFSDLARLGEQGAFPYNVNQVSSDAAIRKFVNGEAAMYLNGSWDIVMFQDEQAPSEFINQVGVIPFPKKDKNSQHVSLAGGYTFGLGISADLSEEEQKVALLLLEMIYSEEVQQRLLYEALRIPSMNIDYDKTLTSPIFAQVVELTEEVDNMFIPYDNMLSPDINQIFLQVTSQLIVGEITAEQAIRLLNQGL